MASPPTILLTAAEHSGDHHAARLIAALRRRRPDARFVGVGGDAMAAAGCRLLARPVDRSAMLLGAISQVGYYRRLIGTVAAALRGQAASGDPWAVHVPVDSPALNWHLARAARRAGLPVVYYIAPQTWAWAPWRVRKLRRLTDAVACILPFEQDYFRARGVHASYVGHPLFDALEDLPLADLGEGARTGAWQIALLSGSRPGEIAAHAPALWQVQQRLSRRYPQARFAWAAVDEAAAQRIGQALGQPLPLQVGRTAQVLARSHLAVAASGTVTLLCAAYGVPTVIFYRAGRLGYHLLARWLIRTPYLSLVNILAQRPLLPELMPWFGDPAALAAAAEDLLDRPEHLGQLRADLLALVAPLRPREDATAADRTAEIVLRTAGLEGEK